MQVGWINSKGSIRNKEFKEYSNRSRTVVSVGLTVVFLFLRDR